MRTLGAAAAALALLMLTALLVGGVFRGVFVLYLVEAFIDAILVVVAVRLALFEVILTAIPRGPDRGLALSASAASTAVLATASLVNKDATAIVDAACPLAAVRQDRDVVRAVISGDGGIFAPVKVATARGGNVDGIQAGGKLYGYALAAHAIIERVPDVGAKALVGGAGQLLVEDPLRAQLAVVTGLTDDADFLAV